MRFEWSRESFNLSQGKKRKENHRPFDNPKTFQHLLGCPGPSIQCPVVATHICRDETWLLAIKPPALCPLLPFLQSRRRITASMNNAFKIHRCRNCWQFCLRVQFLLLHAEPDNSKIAQLTFWQCWFIHQTLTGSLSAGPPQHQTLTRWIYNGVTAN